MAAALARIEAKLDGHIQYSREWRAYTDAAIAEIAVKAGRLDQLKHRGFGVVVGMAIAAGAAGSAAFGKLKAILGVG